MRLIKGFITGIASLIVVTNIHAKADGSSIQEESKQANSLNLLNELEALGIEVKEASAERHTECFKCKSSNNP